MNTSQENLVKIKSDLEEIELGKNSSCKGEFIVKTEDNNVDRKASRNDEFPTGNVSDWVYWVYWVECCDSSHLCLRGLCHQVTQLTDLMTLCTKERLSTDTVISR